MKIITISGLGDFSDDEEELKNLKRTCKAHKVALYPTYYDWEMKGIREDIEAVTQAMWSMPRDQWSDNNLIETNV